MKTKQRVTCVTYGTPQVFEDIDQAKKFFLECMFGSEGAERDRYVTVYEQLMAGKTYCTDEDI